MIKKQTNKNDLFSVETLVGKGVFKLSCQKEELILYSNDGSQSSEEWVNAITLAIAQHRSNSASLRYKKMAKIIIIDILKIVFCLRQSCWPDVAGMHKLETTERRQMSLGTYS